MARTKKNSTAIVASIVFALFLSSCDLTLNKPNTSPSPTPADASGYVEQGKDQITSLNFDGAKTSFATALAVDSNNSEAQFWFDLLEVASIQVSSDMVSVMKDSVGVDNYPTTLNAAFSASWFNTKFYYSYWGSVFSTPGSGYVKGTMHIGGTNTHSFNYYAESADPGIYTSLSSSSYGTGAYFVPEDTGSFFANTWYDQNGTQDNFSNHPDLTYYSQNTASGLSQVNYALLPNINRPAWYSGIISNDPQHLAISDLPFLLLVNVGTRNPGGFNAQIDKLLSSTIGSRLDAVESAINSLPDNTRYYVPWAMITAVSGQPQPSGITSTITIGKPELQLWMAQLEIVKSLLEYIGSLDFTYDFSADTDVLKRLIDNDNTNNPTSTDLATTIFSGTGAFKSNLLKEINPTRRQASKQSFIKAVTDIESAASKLQSAWADSNSYYQGLATELITPQAQAGVQLKATDILRETVIATGKLKTALMTDSLTYMNFTDIGNFIGATTASSISWPTGSGSGVSEIKPSQFWAVNYLDPRNLFETDSNGFKFFVYWSRYNNNFPEAIGSFTWPGSDFSSVDSTFYGLPQTDDAGDYVNASLALKIKAQMFTDLWPNIDAQFNSPLSIEQSYFSLMGWTVKSSSEAVAGAHLDPGAVTSEMNDLVNFANKP